MRAEPTHDGRLEIHEAFRAVTIVTTEGRKLNVLLRDFGWELNIREPNEPDDKRTAWHCVNSDLDFVQPEPASEIVDPATEKSHEPIMAKGEDGVEYCIGYRNMPTGVVSNVEADKTD